MFWNKRKNYRIEVNDLLIDSYGIDTKELWHVLTYAELLDRAYEENYQPNHAAFQILSGLYANYIKREGDPEIMERLERAKVSLDEILHKILSRGVTLIADEPEQEEWITRVIHYQINKTRILAKKDPVDLSPYGLTARDDLD